MTPGTWRAFRAQRDPAMRAIDRKLVRDLSRLQGQVITIGLVIACGVAAYVALRGTHRSLLHARDAYYERYRFPDVFARLERAPDSLRARIEALSGVARAETRIVQPARIRIAGMAEPALAHIVSIQLPGMWLGSSIAQALVASADPEVYRFPPGTPLLEVGDVTIGLRAPGSRTGRARPHGWSAGDRAPERAHRRRRTRGRRRDPSSTSHSSRL